MDEILDKLKEWWGLIGGIIIAIGAIYKSKKEAKKLAVDTDLSKVTTAKMEIDIKKSMNEQLDLARDQITMLRSQIDALQKQVNTLIEQLHNAERDKISYNRRINALEMFKKIVEDNNKR